MLHSYNTKAKDRLVALRVPAAFQNQRLLEAERTLGPPVTHTHTYTHPPLVIIFFKIEKLGHSRLRYQPGMPAFHTSISLSLGCPTSNPASN